MSSFQHINSSKPSQYIVALSFILIISLFSFLQPIMAQNSQVVQVKAFSENLNPYPNLVLSINKGDYVNLNEKGIVFVNLSGSDIPIQSINLQNESLEVASWNLSKGILEVTIRKKSYIDKKVRVVNENGDSVSALEVQFSGNKKLVKTTDSDGVIRIPLALNENIKGKNQFTISGYDIREYFEAPIAILHIKKIEQAIEQVELKENEKSADISAKTIKSRLSTEQIDSISSLRVFYDLINKTPRYEVDNTTQLKLDAKFNELLSKINTGSKSDNYDLLNQISDSTVVEEDIDKLLQKARIDNANMAEQKVLEEKIQLVRDKLNVGFENMTDDSKENLLNEIQQLESILESNKSEFNTNLNTYLAVINELKRRFFDLQELESRLSESERERLKEKKIYQERLLMTLGVVLLFAFLIILLFYLRSKLKKQQRKLIDANKVVKSTNENLENIVLERTFLLNKTFKELDTVLYKASHDLRSPLSSIAGISDLLSRETNNHELTGLLLKTNNRMDKLLKKLSTISEIHKPGYFEEINIREICNSISLSFEETVKERGITFKSNIECDTNVLSIPKLVEVILFHLLENAFFFSWIDNEKKKDVKLDIHIHQEKLLITVADTGIGIEDEIQYKIFDMFYVGSEYSSGNGLGLYIVQKSVDLLNGKMKVSSDRNGSTKFIVQLPINGQGSNTLEFLDSLKA